MSEIELFNKVLTCPHVYADAPGPTTCEHCKPKRDAIVAELAAAEERGRRRGVEERDELRALLGKLVHAMRLWGNDEDGVPEQFYDEWKAADAALAPRDSGKVCNCSQRTGQRWERGHDPDCAVMLL